MIPVRASFLLDALSISGMSRERGLPTQLGSKTSARMRFRPAPVTDCLVRSCFHEEYKSNGGQNLVTDTPNQRCFIGLWKCQNGLKWFVRLPDSLLGKSLHSVFRCLVSTGRILYMFSNLVFSLGLLGLLSLDGFPYSLCPGRLVFGSTSHYPSILSRVLITREHYKVRVPCKMKCWPTNHLRR